jgi:hypothetical protein
MKRVNAGRLVSGPVFLKNGEFCKLGKLLMDNDLQYIK